MNPAALLKALGKLPPAVIELVLQVVQAIVSSPDPRAAAARALEEAARKRTVNEALRRAGPKR